MTDDDLERVDCDACGGTGQDDAEWDGRCVYCHGEGDRYVRHYDDDDELDEVIS